MTTVANGAIGGVVSALLAVTTLWLVRHGTPAISTAIPRGSGASSRIRAHVAAALYGGIAGGCLVALALRVSGLLGVPPGLGDAVGVAVGWSALLFGTVAATGRLVPGVRLDRSSLGELFVFHLVYGLGLGVWIRLTWIT